MHAVSCNFEEKQHKKKTSNCIVGGIIRANLKLKKHIAISARRFLLVEL